MQSMAVGLLHAGCSPAAVELPDHGLALPNPVPLPVEIAIQPNRNQSMKNMKNKRLTSLALVAGLAVASLTLTAFAAEQTDIGTLDEKALARVHPAKPPYSPYAGRNFPTRPLFGDTHLHTSFSMDAGAAGCRLT